MESPASTRQRKLTGTEIQHAFANADGVRFGPILTPSQLASLLQVSRKTIYEWLAKGRFDGAYRKRGKHVLLWRDRIMDILFNGPEWQHD
jgi:excisionase family DNA binding protein